MKLLDGEELQKMVDYSFGDHSGVLGGVPNAYMKKANLSNEEFKQAVASHVGPTMTLCIDNIRLYKRPIEYCDYFKLKPIKPEDREWLRSFDDEDLLELCKSYPQKDFIIFTAFEDVPIEDDIFDKIPDNVVKIYVSDGGIFGGKVIPFPYGIERKMYEGYDHHVILEEYIEDKTEATKLLLICHRNDTGNRTSIKDIFKDKTWATLSPRLEYESYLKAIKDHKFVLCASGNGIESTRIWEVLYMNRVPVMLKHPYIEELLKDFPVLFVDKWEDVTEKLLTEFEHDDVNLDLLDLDKLYAKSI